MCDLFTLKLLNQWKSVGLLYSADLTDTDGKQIKGEKLTHICLSEALVHHMLPEQLKSALEVCRRDQCDSLREYSDCKPPHLKTTPPVKLAVIYQTPQLSYY